MIRIENLRKTFRGRAALKDVSFEVRRGEIFGLLGHNGAGKSTTFGILLGQVHPDSGEAFIDGISVQRERARALAKVGAIFETPGFFDYLSGWANLEILASYSGHVPRSELEEAVRIVGLAARIHDPVRVYSHGMRQRLALAQALVPMPQAVLLDEPTEGLDPEGIHEMRELIRQLNRERGLTVLLSSHLLAEVQQLCDRVAILNQGRLVFTGRWAELAGEGQRFRLELDDWKKAAALGLRVLESAACAAVACAVPGAQSAEDSGRYTSIIELTAGEDIADIVRQLVAAGANVRAVEPLKPTLESLYLDLVSKKQPSA